MQKNEKLKILIDALQMNVTKFAAQMSLSHAAISVVLHGRQNLSEKLIRNINMTYNVDPTWWDDDTTEPRFLNPAEPRPAGDTLTDHERELIELYRSLNTHEKNHLIEFARFQKAKKEL